MRQFGQTEALQSTDRFHIGSNAKAFTATLLATLVEDGKLTWNTKAAEALGPDGPKPLSDYRDVTLVDLLAHQSGLPAYDDTESAEYRQLPSFSGDARAQRRAFAAWLLTHKPQIAPRTHRLYSNAGYAVAAAIAEHVTGQS